MHKVFENSGWLLIDKLSKLFPGLIILALIARQLGPEAFGIWNYAIALTTIAGSIAVLGMDKVAVRELLHREQQQSSIVATILLMRITAAGISMLASMVYVALTRPGQPLYLFCTLFCAINIVLQSFDVFDYFYQAKDDIKKVIIPKVVVFVLFCVIKLIVVLFHATLFTFLWISSLELVITYLIIVIGYGVRYTPHFFSQLDISLGKMLLQQGWPLIFSSLVVVLFVKVDLLLLDALSSSAQLGEYVVAARISELWYAIPTVVSTAILPGLIRKRSDSQTTYLQALEQWLRLSFWVSTAIALLVTCTAHLIISLLYGSQYEYAAYILMIHIWASIPVFLCAVLVQYLIIEGKYKICLYGNIAGLLVNVSLNLVLIRHYGGVGAAISTVAAYFTVFGMLVILDKSRQGWLFTSRMLQPATAFADIRQAHTGFRMFAAKFLSVNPKSPVTHE
ncbi:flippase [Chitinophaga nivalis]|uniref:Flippase n=1 Tax=Chitinophaga nivalis TaxID=2991709 RepID=A0ABT3IEQ5_9BACT|nr:flippase [Chitinophaga nivalis]MCW3467871.1 flippase [Chitinophaga nivalis]MCW3482438.1 flippase [Chitinophaga nivalis]